MENPHNYSAANSLQREAAELTIKEFLGVLKIPKGARILDVGCGSGDVTADLLVPNLPKDIGQYLINGVDLSESMIDHARTKHSSPHLSFHQLDIEGDLENTKQKLYEMTVSHNNNKENDIEGELRRLKLEHQSVDNVINDKKLDEDDINVSLEKEVKKLSIYSSNNRGPNKREWYNKDDQGTKKTIYIDNRFDVVFSFFCLHWIQNQRQALKNIYSMMKPGGEALITLLAKSTIFTMYEKLSEVREWSTYMKDISKYISPYQHSRDPIKDMRDITDEIGFHPLLIDCRNQSFVYRNTSHLQEAIEAVNPICSRISAGEKLAYLSDCIKIVQQYGLADITDEGVTVHYKLLVVHLRK